MWLILIVLLSVFPSCIGNSYVLGADFGTESCRVGLFESNSGELIGTCATPYPTYFPQAGFVEQDPNDWWNAFGSSCNQLFDSINTTKPEIDLENIRAITIDSTACSVVALDCQMRPLRNCLLWCDARSFPQTKYIFDSCKGDEALLINCNGNGPLSAEWMIPKSLWIKQNEPTIWNNASYICEMQDWLNFMLTRRYVASGCNVAARWHWDASKAKITYNDGRPIELLKKINLLDILNKWPKTCILMGEKIGNLGEEAADFIGLRRFSKSKVEVFQGGPDAYVGMIGLGVNSPETIGLINGSSHLHLVINEKFETNEGVWGSYRDAPLEGLLFSEGGQSSTGSALVWFRRLLSEKNSQISYKDLDNEADSIPVGSNGIICLETFQGSRTPITDPMSRAALVGLSLNHHRGHIWRAILEGIVLGTKQVFDSLLSKRENDIYKPSKEIVVGGGATRSKMFLQMHADATNMTITICEQDNAPLSGCAILASIGANLHKDIDQNDSIVSKVKQASRKMIRFTNKIFPNQVEAAKFEDLYQIYKKLYNSVKHINHDLVSTFSALSRESPERSIAKETDIILAKSGRKGFIVPSLLAADQGALSNEAIMCERETHCEWVHIDLCDGSELAQYSLTIGPATILAIRESAPRLKLDVHVVCSDIESMISQLSHIRLDRVTLQYEQLVVEATKRGLSVTEYLPIVIGQVRRLGFGCGLCLKPNTDIKVLESFHSLLEGANPVIEFIDILAVNPGLGGQDFDRRALQKLSFVRENFPLLPYLGIDGGINDDTIEDAAKAGANFIIAGTSIFGRKRTYSDGYTNIRNKIENFKVVLKRDGI